MHEVSYRKLANVVKSTGNSLSTAIAYAITKKANHKG